MNPNQLQAMMAALRGSTDTETPTEQASGTIEEQAEPQVTPPSVQLAHHKRLMVKAPTLAARRVHRKLFMHHQKKLNTL